MKRIKTTHIGSTKFYEVFERMNTLDTLDDKIVLSVGCFIHSDDTLFAGLSAEEVTCKKAQLDQLHLIKIDDADEVLVINCGGYLKNSTLHELCYAFNAGKHIRWLEDYVMFCPQCDMAGFEKDHFFHAALDLDVLDDILSSNDEAAIGHLIGDAPGYDALRVANWHGLMAPIVRLENGTIALQIDSTCGRCRDTHATRYVVSGCHRGAFCYVVDEQGHFLADLRNQPFVCDDCTSSNRSPAPDYEFIYRRRTIRHADRPDQDASHIIAVSELPGVVKSMVATIAEPTFERLVLNLGLTELTITTCEKPLNAEDLLKMSLGSVPVYYHTISFDAQEASVQFLEQASLYGLGPLVIDFDHDTSDVILQSAAPISEERQAIIAKIAHVVATDFNRSRVCCRCFDEIERENGCACSCHDEHEERPGGVDSPPPSQRPGYVPVTLLHLEEQALEAGAERERLQYE